MPQLRKSSWLSSRPDIATHKRRAWSAGEGWGAVGNLLTHRVALDPGSSLPRIKSGVARPGHAIVVSRASVASALARAERDPGPNARLAKHNISSHSSSYAIALPAIGGENFAASREASSFTPACAAQGAWHRTG